MTGSGFARRVVAGLPFYSCEALEEIPTLRHGFSTRHGGVSALPEAALNLSHLPWDTHDAVDENRRRFLAALHLQPCRLLTLHQIHSDRVHVMKEAPTQWNRPEADALETNQAGCVLAVQTADCFPILIADPQTGSIAAIHSGWRGALARIFLAGVRSMIEAFDSDPAQLIVAIGPAIRSCCFEVGPEVVEMFRDGYPDLRLARERVHRPGKFLLDLRSALDAQFEEAGISPHNVHDLGACTRCRPDEFFSYRAEGLNSGRMMAVIARLP